AVGVLLDAQGVALALYGHEAGGTTLELGDEDGVGLERRKRPPVVPRVTVAEGAAREAEQNTLVLGPAGPDDRLPVRHPGRIVGFPARAPRRRLRAALGERSAGLA